MVPYLVTLTNLQTRRAVYKHQLSFLFSTVVAVDLQKKNNLDRIVVIS